LQLFASEAAGQSTADTGFVRYKQFVDSITHAVSSDSLLVFRKLVGMSKEMGKFDERCYYQRRTKDLRRIEYHFETDTSASYEQCYYYKGELVGLVINNEPLYCIEDKWYDANGILIKKEERLLNFEAFEKGFRNVTMNYIAGQ
jgi:hypothetical protein